MSASGGGGAKVLPQLGDAGSTKVLNLTVLQRIDPFVEEILMTAAHVTFYEFNVDRSQWSRKDVEGSLFVVKRNAQPRFQFIVMNRRNTDNLVEDLLGDFEYEVQVPYLLYRNAAQEVNGIWFYNPQDCEAIGNLFSRILNAFSKVPPKPKVSSSKRSEFEELEAIPTTAVIEGPLEPQPSSSACVPDVPDDSFVNFFSAAVNVGNAAIVGQSSGAMPSHIPTAVPSPKQALQTAPSLTTSIPVMPLIDTTETSISSTNRAADLVKPSFFTPPTSSSSLVMPSVSSALPTALPLHPPVTMRPYGTPLLQPFPPPTPPPSLTPSPNYVQNITRDQVRDALLRLVQNDSFIDMVYQEMLNAHHS